MDGKTTLRLAMISLFVIIISTFSGCISKDSGYGEMARATPELTVDAYTLYKDYKTNETEADAKYKGKIIEVTGRVKSISLSWLNPHITLECGHQGLGSGIVCHVPPLEGDRLKRLGREKVTYRDGRKKIEWVPYNYKRTVKGRCEGKSSVLGNIEIKDCIIS